jgi:hypothetical protein
MNIRRIVVASAVALGIVAVSGGVQKAEADLITFDFTGTVITVAPELLGTFSLGDAMTGSYTFDSTTPGVSGPDTSIYNLAITALDVTVGSYVATASSPGSILITNDFLTTSADLYLATNFVSGPTISNTFGTWDVITFLFNLTDTTGTVFTTTDLPLSPPNLAAFDITAASLLFRDESQGVLVAVSADLNSLTSPVPEPGTLLLIGSGLAGFGITTRRRNRKDR